MQSEPPTVMELVDRVQGVCPLPAAAQRVLQILSNEDALLEQVAEVIATDAGLAAEVMRIANSPAFGRRSTIDRLEHAVAMLGMAELRRMAAAMAMLAAFAPKQELSFGFHQTAVLSGSIARQVASLVPSVDRSQAFLCGLLCEIGAMACAAVDPVGYAELWQRLSSAAGDRDALETEQYGGSTREIAGRLLRRNDIPDTVAIGVEQGASLEAGLLARVAHFARLAAPVVVAVARTDPGQLGEKLSPIRNATRLEPTEDALAEACIRAAGVAVRAARR